MFKLSNYTAGITAAFSIYSGRESIILVVETQKIHLLLPENTRLHPNQARQNLQLHSAFIKHNPLSLLRTWPFQMRTPKMPAFMFAPSTYTSRRSCTHASIFTARVVLYSSSTYLPHGKTNTKTQGDASASEHYSPKLEPHGVVVVVVVAVAV